jgi:hypothetical protein
VPATNLPCRANAYYATVVSTKLNEPPHPSGLDDCHRSSLLDTVVTGLHGSHPQIHGTMRFNHASVELRMDSAHCVGYFLVGVEKNRISFFLTVVPTYMHSRSVLLL